MPYSLIHILAKHMLLQLHANWPRSIWCQSVAQLRRNTKTYNTTNLHILNNEQSMRNEEENALSQNATAQPK